MKRWGLIVVFVRDIFNTAANNITESLHVRNELLKSSLFRLDFCSDGDTSFALIAVQ